MAENQRPDDRVLDRIESLVATEHTLHEQPSPTDTDRRRLAEIRIELDQCWDLLRQRRAKREFGDDPDAAQVRPPEVVESYQQ
jgi:hypothetical protein